MWRISTKIRRIAILEVFGALFRSVTISFDFTNSVLFRSDIVAWGTITGKSIYISHAMSSMQHSDCSGYATSFIHQSVDANLIALCPRWRNKRIERKTWCRQCNALNCTTGSTSGSALRIYQLNVGIALHQVAVLLLRVKVCIFCWYSKSRSVRLRSHGAWHWLRGVPIFPNRLLRWFL